MVNIIANKSATRAIAFRKIRAFMPIVSIKMKDTRRIINTITICPISTPILKPNNG